MFVEIVTYTFFKQCHITNAIVLRHPDTTNEFQNSIRSIAATAHTPQCGHSRVVPAIHMVFFHQTAQLAFAHDGVVHIQTCELDLTRFEDPKLVEEPFIERTVIFVLERTQRVGDPFHRIVLTMRPIVHGVDLPLITCAVMRRVVDDAIHCRVTHIDIGMRHIDLCAQNAGSVRKFPIFHSLK